MTSRCDVSLYFSDDNDHNNIIKHLKELKTIRHSTKLVFLKNLTQWFLYHVWKEKKWRVVNIEFSIHVWPLNVRWKYTKIKLCHIMWKLVNMLLILSYNKRPSFLMHTSIKFTSIVDWFIFLFRRRK